MDQYFIILGGIVALFLFIILPRLRENRFSSLQKHMHESDDWGQGFDNRFTTEVDRDYGDSAWAEDGDAGAGNQISSRRGDREVDAAELALIFATPKNLEALKVIAMLESNSIEVFPRRAKSAGQGGDKIELFVGREDEQAALSLLSMMSHS